MFFFFERKSLNVFEKFSELHFDKCRDFSNTQKTHFKRMKDFTATHFLMT